MSQRPPARAEPGGTQRLSGGARYGAVRTGTISNDSTRLLITRGSDPRSGCPSTSAAWHALCSRVCTRIDAGRRGKVAGEGPRWFEKPRHAFSVANGRSSKAVRQFPKTPSRESFRGRNSARNDAGSASAWFDFFLGIDDDQGS